MEARKNTSRLFPVESPFGAICAELDINGNIIFSAANTTEFKSKYPNLANEEPGILLKARGNKAMVLSNGLSFVQPLDGEHIMLVDFLVRGPHSNVSSINVDGVIDPGMIAILDQNDEDITVCGVSNTGKRILAYTIVQPKSAGKGIRRVATDKSADGRIGFTVRELDGDDKRTITNITSCRHHEDGYRHIVIGYNNGEIELYKLKASDLLKNIPIKDLFVLEKKLKSANEDYAGMSLMLTDNGRLVAYSSKAKKIEVWDLAKAGVAQSHEIANVGELSLSHDGVYLVARDNNQEHKQAVQVYELPNDDSTKLQHSRLETKNKIESVVVGHEGSLISSHYNDQGEIVMQNEGKMDLLLQGKITAVNLEPTPERVSEAHRTGGKNTKSIFSKFGTLKLHGAKKHAAPVLDKPVVVEAKQPESSVVVAAEPPVVVSPSVDANNNNNAEVPKAAETPAVVTKPDDKMVEEKLEALKEQPPAAAPKAEKNRWPLFSIRKKKEPVAVPAAPPAANDNTAQPKDGTIMEMKLN